MDRTILFNIMKFQVLCAGFNESTRSFICDSYLVAWGYGVYPIGHEGAHWHSGFENDFRVTKSDMEAFLAYLDGRWRAGRVPTVYQIETDLIMNPALGSEWHRSKVIRALRYLYLFGNLFDDAFWTTIMTPGEIPSEAHGITSPFNRDQNLYFH